MADNLRILDFVLQQRAEQERQRRAGRAQGIALAQEGAFDPNVGSLLGLSPEDTQSISALGERIARMREQQSVEETMLGTNATPGPLPELFAAALDARSSGREDEALALEGSIKDLLKPIDFSEGDLAVTKGLAETVRLRQRRESQKSLEGGTLFKDIANLRHWRETLGPNHPDYLLAAKILGAKGTEKGMLVRVDPETGEVVIAQGSGVAEAARVPGSRIDQLNEELFDARNGSRKIDEMLASLDQPNVGGVPGMIQGGLQTVRGIAGDISGLVPGAPAYIDRTIDEINRDIVRGKITDGQGEVILEHFQPDIPKNEVLEWALAYDLAKAKRGTRITDDAVQASRKLVKTKGVRDVDSIRVRLRTLRNELETSADNRRKRLKAAGAEPVEPQFEAPQGRRLYRLDPTTGRLVEAGP